MLRSLFILAAIFTLNLNNLFADCLGEAKRQYCANWKDSTSKCKIPESFIERAIDSCALLYEAGDLADYPTKHILPRLPDTLETNFAFQVMCQGFVQNPNWYNCIRHKEVSYAKVPANQDWKSVVCGPNTEKSLFVHTVSDSEIIIVIKTTNNFYLYGFRDYVGDKAFAYPDSFELIKPEEVKLDFPDSLKLSKTYKAQKGKEARLAYRKSLEKWEDRLKGKLAWDKFHLVTKDTSKISEKSINQYYSGLFNFDGFISNTTEPILLKEGILETSFFSRVSTSTFFTRKIGDLLIVGSTKNRQIWTIINPSLFEEKR